MASSSSRLDRLLVLLSTSSTSSTRSLAAKQLGSVAGGHPTELPSLLARLHPLLHSHRWSARMAAVEALEEVLKATPAFPDPIKKEEPGEGPKRPRLTFDNFDLSAVLRESERSTTPDQEEEQAGASTSVEKQRDELNKKLGLDVAARLGVPTEEIFSKEDLTTPKKLQSNGSGCGGGSARERNRLKRAMSKQKAQQAATAKKQRLAPKLYQPPPKNEEKHPSSPLTEFCEFLAGDLSDRRWEVRHGACTALREIVRLRGREAGGGCGPEDLATWLEDLAVRLLSVIACDRFGDFVSDAVVAPVRESAAQAVGAVLTLMEPHAVKRVVAVLLNLLEQDNWQCRHGALLGVKYVLAVRPDLTSVLLEQVYPALYRSLQDRADDVVGVAAAALIPVVQTLFHGNVVVAVEALTDRLWAALETVDDVTSSTHATMQLLAAILKQKRSQEQKSFSVGQHDDVSLIVRVPHLLPYLSHSSTQVRRAALSTLHTLTAEQAVAERFLQAVAKPLASNLFQRSLLEHNQENLELIEQVWKHLCDYTPLNPLLTSTCPLYGGWVTLISLPPMWPLSPNLLVGQKEEAETPMPQYLGGPEAQHSTDTVERDRLATRSRCLGARLLGKLAGFVARPVPGLDYSNDSMPPMEMFVSKILLPQLQTCSAHQRTALCLLISEWSEQHDISGVPESLRSAVGAHLTEPVSYDETVAAFTQLQTDAGDFVATLKHYKLQLPEELPADNYYRLTFDQIKHFLTTTDFRAVVSSNSKVKHKTAESILERLHNSLLPSVAQILADQEALAVTALACAAGAAVGLGSPLVAENKLNPLIKPLMESVKKERNEQLQSFSARKLARVLEIYVEQQQQQQQQQIQQHQQLTPVDKVIRNLVSFVSADPSVTPAFLVDPLDQANKRIVTLALREAQSSKACSNSNSAPKNNAKASQKKSNNGKSSQSVIQDALSATSAITSIVSTNSTRNGNGAEMGASTSSSPSKTVNDAARSEKLRIQTRGSECALKTIVRHFGADVFERLPKLRELTLGTIAAPRDKGGELRNPGGIVPCLRALEVIAPMLSEALHARLCEEAVPGLVVLLRSDHSSVRHMAARCLAQLSRLSTALVMTTMVLEVAPLLESTNVCVRQGAMECVALIAEGADSDLLPYVVLLVVPVLGKMSDLNEDVRLLATNTFATLIRLLPLDGTVPDPENLPLDMSQRKAKERRFLAQLANPGAACSVEDEENWCRLLPPGVPADGVILRPYQRSGLDWLAFLNRYGLHGILCDDMGLGKTLQAVCMLATHHYFSAGGKRHNGAGLELPSLVVCPPTLCTHWVSEIERFVSPAILHPLMYAGSRAARAELAQALPHVNLVVTSYEALRSDVELLAASDWNYVILDEGHVIRNPRTKTTLAVKRLRAKHRLVLSGTPIQNSVLELWSLFDFLMPGFLGTASQFMARFARPIIAAREAGGLKPAAPSPQPGRQAQEAGALAMEALHRQVLPFILRRTKEDVLSDLPPKITQDYYCTLSPLQIRLYEHFAGKHKQQQQQRQQQQPQQQRQQQQPQQQLPPHAFQALQYLRKVCNHPKLVLDESHPEKEFVDEWLQSSGSNLDDIMHSGKLPALMDLLLQCGIGANESDSCAVQHRALVFFQLRAMMDLVQKDLLEKRMPSVTFLRLDGSVAPADRQAIVDKFNGDVSIDLLLVTTAVGGLGLNLTGADTVIFVEHDWNPMKDLQAMDRAHRIGQKKVVNVYRLITRHTIEEKILGLQQFKLKTANTVIGDDNASLQSMATDRLFDLFSLGPEQDNDHKKRGNSAAAASVRSFLEGMPELWDEEEYEKEYDVEAYASKSVVKQS